MNASLAAGVGSSLALTADRARKIGSMDAADRARVTRAEGRLP